MKSSELSIIMPVTLALALTDQAYRHVDSLLSHQPHGKYEDRDISAGLEQMCSHLHLAADHLREALRAYDEHMS